MSSERETPNPNAEETTPPLSGAQSFWYSLASLGCGMFLALNNSVLPLFLKQYTSDARILGLLSSSHSVEGVVIQPIVGSVSDRTRTRWGRRRPFMLIFFPLSALFLVITPVLGGLPSSTRLGAIIACIFLFTILFNIAYDPYRALMPDITPEKQRGRVNSHWSFIGVIGQAGIAFLPIPLAAKFVVAAVVMVVTALLTCWRTREPDAPQLSAAAHKKGGELRAAIRGLTVMRQAAKGLLVFFLSGIGIGAVLPNLTLFVQAITHCTDQEATMAFSILMISTAVGVLPAGMVADRIGPKKLLIISLAIIGVASLCALKVNTLAQVQLVLVLAGLGNAAMSAANYPMMTQIVPREEIGLYTGFVATMESLAQPLTVVITGTLVNQGSYRVIFGVCALSMLLSLLVLSTVNQKRAVDEISVYERGEPAAA
jgi:maltose/moltooligosaccharide transporter